MARCWAWSTAFLRFIVRKGETPFPGWDHFLDRNSNPGRNLGDLVRNGMGFMAAIPICFRLVLYAKLKKRCICSLWSNEFFCFFFCTARNIFDFGRFKQETHQAISLWLIFAAKFGVLLLLIHNFSHYKKVSNFHLLFLTLNAAVLQLFPRPFF